MIIFKNPDFVVVLRKAHIDFLGEPVDLWTTGYVSTKYVLPLLEYLGVPSSVIDQVAERMNIDFDIAIRSQSAGFDVYRQEGILNVGPDVASMERVVSKAIDILHVPSDQKKSEEKGKP